MANGFDRLERFFASKRKLSPIPGELSTSAGQQPEPQFPSPSFIRPRTSRMTARDEIRLRQASERSPSVPDIASLRLGSPHSRSSASASSPSPVRSPSFTTCRPDPLVMGGTREFQFPEVATRNGEITPLSLTFNPTVSDAPHVSSSRSSSPLAGGSCTRLDTPPSSDREDEGPSVSNLKSMRLLTQPYGAPPTPSESPQLSPIPDSLSCSKALDMLEKALFNDFEDELVEFDDLSPSDSYSDSGVSPSARLSCCSSTLREPDVNDFLNLSDDDIAESTADHSAVGAEGETNPSLPSIALSLTSTHVASSSLLTLTPPRASRPATAAAFEAARIANRYDFDLVYVVNLWPGGPTSQDKGSETDAPLERPLIGRLLAAHGLHHVPSPLQISSFVHTTILRSDGWVEYRNQDAEPHDLARGYACAFFTGQYARDSSSQKADIVSGVRLSEKIDRGIVFAAYRKPRAGDSRLGHSSSQEELGELHNDAEALVEMLIDIHVASRRRNPPSSHRLSDEAGPMPSTEIRTLSV